MASKESGQFDTRHNSFGVLSALHRRIVGAAPFVQPQGTSPRKRARRALHHARMNRGCLIAKLTHGGNHLVKPRRFRHQPVFSGVLDAASVSTRINTRYQADNRCRQRHRVRKAVFVQLVCIRPKAFCNVIRSGQ